jgi:5-methylcytosine-specific restriction endonuclease McrA
MTSYISEMLRRQVAARAEGRCEYCRIHQDDRLFAHEIDHIFAEKHGGQAQMDNLCLACNECNRFKGSDLCSLDSETDAIVSLYHPRRDRWADHFRVLEGMLEALTATGRVTARLLHFNDADAVDRRRMLIEAGRYPENPA